MQRILVCFTVDGDSLDAQLACGPYDSTGYLSTRRSECQESGFVRPSKQFPSNIGETDRLAMRIFVNNGFVVSVGAESIRRESSAYSLRTPVR